MMWWIIFLLAAIFIQDPMNDPAPPLQKIHQYDETRTAMSTWDQLWKLVPILDVFFESPLIRGDLDH